MLSQHTSLGSRLTVLLAALMGLVLLPACARGSQTPAAVLPEVTAVIRTPEPTLTATRAPTVTHTRAPTRTATSTPSPSVAPTLTALTLTVTPFPRSLDAYGITYDPQAEAEIPFRRSAAMPIWENALPLQPVEVTPEFVRYPVPDGLRPVDSNEIIKAGCVPGIYGAYECAEDSPLRSYPCDHLIAPIAVPEELLLAPHPDGAVVAECITRTDNWETAEGSGLYITGCAFRGWVGYILNTGNGYVLVDTPEALRQQFAPVESAAEAISYAQMLTGLEADFDPAYDPSLLYLQERIVGTHAVEEGEIYRINLFHRPGCFCEPYIYSQVTVQVGRDGALKWTGAEPYALTTGFGCAD